MLIVEKISERYTKKMTDIIMHGCNGHMGKVITNLLKDDEQAQIVAGIDPVDEGKNSYPVFKSLKDCNINADVIIDFASAKAIDDLLDYCEEKNIPAVICTTGLSDEQLERINKVSEKVALLKSANMSLGINTLFRLLQDAAKVLVPAGFDIEIVEKHHNKKLDAPSGTALALADSIKEVLDDGYYYKYDRSTQSAKRDPLEIGISSVRGGTIVGEHEVIFAGEDEIIEFKHTANSKAVFAKGSIEAAKFLKGKKAALYDMQDVIAARN